jgi:succinylarginine dihydrolase
MSEIREHNFDGLVGPTHNYAGLSVGNVASEANRGRASNPKAAALQGLAKARFVHRLGVKQAVLPPLLRPSLRTLRSLGYSGSDEVVLAKAFSQNEHLVRCVSSASSMWAANAATVAPATDTADQRTHFVPANLVSMFHRAIEARETTEVLRAIFADETHFVVHDPLPSTAHFADEGGANHTRLAVSDRPALHLFAWGRKAWGEGALPQTYPARQTDQASLAIARLLALEPTRALFAQQHPNGIDHGAFHTDVLAVGHGSVLLMHELAFLEREALLDHLRTLLGDELKIVVGSEAELPVSDAVKAYPFNSMLVSLEGGRMAIIAPTDAKESEPARRYLERVVSEDNPIDSLHYIDVRQSMDNGGGPACLRLRVPLSEEQAAAVHAKVWIDDAHAARLEAWVERHYRDKLEEKDLGDPALHREVMTALDELSGWLGLPALYEFQR